MNIIGIARRIADNQRFQHFILGVIVVGAIVIGVETSPRFTARHNTLVVAVEMLIQAIFVAEIAIRILAHWPRPVAFFRNGWNVFDFVVIAASLLPHAGPFAMVARLARLLRITRVVSVFPELRLIIGTMVRSIPSMGHVIVLLSVLLYVYAVLGFHFFREASPTHWGSLGAALLTPAQMQTLEGSVEIQGRELTEPSVLDITPTILALLGLPVAEDMDGRVLTEAIDPAFLKRHPVTSIPTYETASDGDDGEREPIESPIDDEVREQLRSLGYID